MIYSTYFNFIKNKLTVLLFLICFLVPFQTILAQSIVSGNEDPDFQKLALNGAVRPTAFQADGKILVGGGFTTYGVATVNRFMRLNVDGTLDTDFQAILGTGFNGIVNSILIQADGKILVGGNFSTFNDNPVNRLVRLNADGTLDSTFISLIGTGGSGVNSLEIDANGKIIVAGTFERYDGNLFYNNDNTNYISNIIRLNNDATLDDSFVTTTFGLSSGGITKTVVQPDGKILVIGEFSNYNQTSRNKIARLNSDGSLDTDFVVGTSINGSPTGLILMPDGNILFSHLGTSYNGTTVNRVIKLNANGSLDTDFAPTFTTFANAYAQVDAIYLQADGKILAGGNFDQVNGNSGDFFKYRYLARLLPDGSLDTDFNLSSNSIQSRVFGINIQADDKIIAVTNNSIRRLLNEIGPALPTAPSNLVATAGNGEVTISFTAAGTNGGGAITNYEYTLDGGDTWIAFSPAVTTSPITISGLTNNTEYIINIRALNEDGAGLTSQPLTTTPTLFTPPTNIVATPGDGQVELSFTESTPTTASVITNYEYSLDGGDTWNPFNPAVTTSPVTITGLDNLTTYLINLRAINEDDGEGMSSPSSLFVTPALFPTAPTNLSATPGDQSITIDFTDASTNGGSDIENYEYSLDGGATWIPFNPAVTTSPVTITGLTNGTAYDIIIRAVNGQGAGEPSAPLNASPLPPPTAPVAPTGLIANAGNGQITIGFTLADDGGSVVTNYEYTLDGGDTWTPFNPAVTSSPVTITGLTNGTAYTIQLRALNAQGAGDESSTITATPVDLASLGCITIVTSGGEAEGSTWTYSNNTILPNSATNVSLNVSDVLAKMELGVLTLAGKCITVNADINYTQNNSNGITLKASDNVILNEDKRITTNGGDVIFWADSDVNNNGYIAFSGFGGHLITTNGGNVILGGGAGTTEPTGVAHGGSSTHGFSVDSFASATSSKINTTKSGETGGNVIIRGKSSGNFSGVYIQNLQIFANDLIIEGETSLVSATIFGVRFGSSNIYNGSNLSSIFDLDNNLTITGINTANSYSGNSIRTGANPRFYAKGDITINSSGIMVLNSSQDFLDIKPGKTLTVNIDGTANFTMPIGDPANNQGKVVIQSYIQNSFTSNFSTSNTNWVLSDKVSELTIGKSTNTANITIGSAASVSGPITLYGGNIAINAALTASNNTINLVSNGTVNQTAAITADNLSLNGTGTFTLNNTSNNVATIAGGNNTTKLGSLSFTDTSGGLTIDTVGSINGITASGTVLVETLAGDISLANDVVTDNTSVNAIVINAGKSTAIGTITGGDIIVNGSPNITTGANGIAKLFSGSEAGSTGLTDLAGGFNNVRFDVDETTTTFDPVLVGGNAYALYRESIPVVEPDITSFSPIIAGNGETVVITGTGFTGVTTVNFGNQAATSFVVDSDTQITAIVGNGTSGALTVTNSAGSDFENGFIFKVVEYLFEGNTLDNTDANLDGTVIGTATFEPGASGQAICFTNTNASNATTVQNYLLLPNNLIRDRGANFTISLRFKTTTWGAILGYQNNGVGDPAFVDFVPILYVREDGKLSANFWQGESLNVLSTNRVDDGNWHKVDFSASPGSISVYIDDVLAGSSNGTIDHLNMSFNQLGAANTFGAFWPGVPVNSWLGFNGCIDDFIIIDRALTAAEIQEITALPEPTIVSFSPSSATVGEAVTIMGTNFTGATSVIIGGVAVQSFVVVSETEIIATVANGSSSGTVSVTTAGGTATAGGFSFYDVSITGPLAGAYLPGTSGMDAGNFVVDGFAPSDVLYVTINIEDQPSGTTLRLGNMTGLTAAPGYNLGSNFTLVSFTGTLSDVNTALAALELNTSSPGFVKINVSATSFVPGYLYSPVNGHYYKYVSWPEGVSGGDAIFDQIKASAASETFKGQNGYLLTITSQDEQNFIQNNVPGANILMALTDRVVEGQWRWDAGPEAGTLIRSGGTNQPGQYNIWCSGEPNNSGAGQDYAVTKFSGNNCWDDQGPPNSSFPGTIQGYVVEFGDATGVANQDWIGFARSSVTHAVVCEPTLVGAAPSNQTQNQSGPGDCDAVFNWIEPTFAECFPGLTFTVTRTIDPIPPGGIFPPAYNAGGAALTEIYTGVTTVTYRAALDTDPNTFTEVFFTLTLEDTEDPVLTLSGSTADSYTTDNNACSRSLTLAQLGVTASATDNCETATNPVITYSLSDTGTPNISFPYTFDLGSTTVYARATDLSGNFDQKSFTVVVSDNQSPTFTSVPGNQSVTTAAGVCTYTHANNSWNATATDNCAVTSLIYTLTGATTGTGTTLNGVTFNLGTTTVTWTATDAAGNSTTSTSYTITVADNQNPSITNKASLTNRTVNTAAGECTYTHSGTAWNALATDNCSVTSLTYTLTDATTGSGTTLNGVTFNLGNTTVTWTARDAANNQDTHSFTVTVTDNQAPVITNTVSLIDRTVNTDTGVCSYTHSGTAWNATATDNCGVTSLSYTSVGAGVSPATGTSLAGSVFQSGITTITWTATDAASNSITYSFTVTVEDNEGPSVTQPVTVGPPNPDVNGYNCGNTLSFNATLGACDIFRTVAKPTFTDPCNPPVTLSWSASHPNQVVPLTDFGAFIGADFPVGITTVTFTGTDANNNPTDCTVLIEVIDDQNPTITNCPIDQTLINDPGQCSRTVSLVIPTAGDNCAVSLVEYEVFLDGAATPYITGTNFPNSITFAVGVNTVIYTIYDTAQPTPNTVSCSYTITIVDLENPTIVCGGDRAVDTDAGQCTYTHSGTGWDAVASDNCAVDVVYTLSGATLGVVNSTLDGVSFNIGTTTVSAQAIDASGNTSVPCSFDVVITDNEAPVISCPSNGVLGAGSILFFTDLSLGINQLLQALTDGGYNVTFTSNNTDFQNEIAIPNAYDAAFYFAQNLSPDPVSVNLLANFAAAGNKVFYFDWTLNNTLAALFDYSYTGNTNNTQVTVTDPQLTAALPANPFTLNNPGWSVFSTGMAPIGTTQVLATFSNSDGAILSNPGRTIFIYGFISDAIAFDDLFANNLEIFSVVNTDPGVCTYTHLGTAWDATATDNCTVSTITYVLTGATTGTGNSLNGVAFNLGVTTVTWTVTDAANNTNVCSFDVTVEDNEAPVASCGGDQTVDTDPGVCTYAHSGTAWDATATDNCSVASITYALTGATTGTGTTLDGVVFNLGVTTVTWTATDGSGNTNVCSNTVTVLDNQNPVISCVGNQTVDTDLLVCTYTHNGTAWDATATDNCSVASIIYVLSGDTSGSGTSLSGVTFNLGTTTVTWTATDSSGNTAVCSFDVTVEDNEAPHVTSTSSMPAADIQGYVCGDIITLPAGLNSCVAFRSVAIPTWADNCGTVTATTFSADNGVNLTNFGMFVTANFPVGITTVTFTATDDNGNTGVCSITIEVQDTQAPTITGCPPSQTVNNDPGLCTATLQLVIPTAQDNCAVVGVSYLTTGATTLSGTEFPNQLTFNVGVTVVTYTITDAAGLSVSCSYTITVMDNEAPTALCADDFTIQLDANGQASITTAMVDNGSFDNCAFTLSLSQTDFDCSHVGVNVVTLTITDASGNARTCSVNVTVEDNVAPVAVCLPNFDLFLDASGMASITVADIDGGSSDACGIASSTISKTNFTCADVGPNVVTLTVTDNNGNVSTCTTTVTVIDNTPPVASCVAPFTIQLDANGQAIITAANIDNGSSDACGIASRTISKTNFTCADLGANTITLTVTDVNGNVSTCSTVVTVVDTIPPAITCVANQVVSTDLDVCTYTHPDTSWDAVVTDNCSVNAAYVLTGATSGAGASLAGVTFNLGATSVSWTATDSSGNTAVCTFTVLVQDTQIPTVVSTSSASNPDIQGYSCGQAIVIPAGVNSCETFRTVAIPQWADNCTAIASTTYSADNGVNLTNFFDSFVGGNFPVGITTITFTATDFNGNTGVCSITIEVEDLQAPTVTGCPTNQTVNTDPGMCTAVVNLTIPSATDNCGVTSIVYSTTGATTLSGNGFPNALTFNQGVTNVTYLISDAAGNTVSCNFTITVNDVEAPVISCSNITQPADAGMCSAVVALGVTVTDNCTASPTLTGVRSDGLAINAPFPVGTTTVTWNATDAAGNVAATCTQTVTITDDQAPAIAGLPANISVNNTPGQCGAVVSWTAPTATDNCPGATIAQTAGPAGGSQFPVGTTTVTYTATDASGNTSTASFTVTVTDNEAPVASCLQAITISLDANGVAQLPVGDVNLASSDNCGIASIVLSQNTFSCADLGLNTVTMTVTDVNGNSSTCTIAVTVVDTIAPVAQCIAGITLSLDANGTATLAPADVDNGSSDNCNVTLSLSQTAFTCADLGTNTVTLTATDSSGNSSTCTVAVTVIDEIAPTVVCNNFTLELGPDGTAILDPAMIGGNSTDNCAIVITAVSIDQFDCGDIGAPIMVTYFATDASGNSASCNAFVTVVDNLAPVVVCPEDMLVDTDPGSITYTVPDFFANGMATATDNCTVPVTIFSQTPAPGTLLLDGTYIFTFTATDASGNVGQCSSFELTVQSTLGVSVGPDYSTLTMYPNPASSQVTIGNPNSLMIDTVSIYDINGRLVRAVRANATNDVSVDVSDLSSSVYMVIITGEDGASTVKRLIKK
jgi:uncharacterized delta-60 repeat protein